MKWIANGSVTDIELDSRSYQTDNKILILINEYFYAVMQQYI
jgi:hypothetical protein